MTELKPCPFCGGEPTLDEGEAFEVMCRKCFRAGTVFYSTRAEAAEAWNTRAEFDGIPMTEENMAEHGWVRERTCDDTAIEGEWFECSECGTVKQLIHPNFCPNCGAKVENERTPNG